MCEAGKTFFHFLLFYVYIMRMYVSVSSSDLKYNIESYGEVPDLLPKNCAFVHNELERDFRMNALPREVSRCLVSRVAPSRCDEDQCVEEDLLFCSSPMIMNSRSVRRDEKSLLVHKVRRSKVAPHIPSQTLARGTFMHSPHYAAMEGMSDLGSYVITLKCIIQLQTISYDEGSIGDGRKLN
jgi:hypothetical protein